MSKKKTPTQRKHPARKSRKKSDEPVVEAPVADATPAGDIDVTTPASAPRRASRGRRGGRGKTRRGTTVVRTQEAALEAEPLEAAGSAEAVDPGNEPVPLDDEDTLTPLPSPEPELPPEAGEASSFSRSRLRRHGRAAPAPRPPQQPVDPAAPGATVETRNDAVVIRFPPAAPHPFVETAQRPVVAEAQPASPAAREAHRPDLRERPPAARERDSRPVRDSEPPPRHDVLDDPEAFARLSPSQKRRLRRKRRAQLLRERQPGAAPPGEPDEVNEPAALSAEPDAAEARAPQIEPPGPHELSPAEEALEAAAEVISGTADEVEPPARAEDERGGRRRRRRPRRRVRRDLSVAEGRSDSATDAPAYDALEEEAREAPRRAAAQPAAAEPAEEVEEEAAPAGPVTREMIINVVPREECRIGILDNNKLEEIYLERASAESHVGNIYKGVVTNVEPSIQAAFVDFGLGKNGFLHISDLHPKYFPNNANATENVGRKLPRRHRPPIQRCLRRGQEIIVQITKEGIGTKGPTLTTYLAIPGRFLVMMPGMGRMGVSRKIEDEDTRHELRDLLAELELPEEMGFIARTAALGRSKRELQSDLNYLLRLWRNVDKHLKERRAPAVLYQESDLVIRTIRDVFTSDIQRIVVDDPQVAEQAREFLSIFSPKSRDLVVEYTSDEPIFHKYGIEAELERLHSRHVPLRSGGSLVIDQTEALVAIDVNSGRYRTEDDAETTAYKINLEAADEIPRQLRLRDLGGVVICDFIDMREERHRREVERRLIRNLKQHKERAKVLRMSQFGIIEMTRQRQRASLTRSVYQDCTHCRGTGLVKTAESVALDVLRQIQLAVTREYVRTIELTVSFDVAHFLQNRKRALLHDLETRYGRTIFVRPDHTYGLDQVLMQCFDTRGRPVPQP